MIYKSIIFFLFLFCQNTKPNKTGIIELNIFLPENYLNNPKAKLQLPFYFSNRPNVTKGTPLAGEINNILRNTGIGQSISLDIRYNNDSIIFNKEIAPTAFGIYQLEQQYLIFARNEAGEATDCYLFLLNSNGEVTSHLCVQHTLGYSNNKALDLLQSNIDDQGRVHTSEIVYEGINYIDPIKGQKKEFIAYRVDKTYLITPHGKFKQTSSIAHKQKRTTLKELYGVNLIDF